ncbi:MAG: hypothetical protein ABJJ37_01960 [Roseibium sp.]
MTEKNSGTMVIPFLVMAVFAVAALSGPIFSKMQSALYSADRIVRTAATVEQIDLTALTIGRAATMNSAGYIVPPTPNGTEIPSGIRTPHTDKHDQPYLYCTLGPVYDSPTNPMLAVVSGGPDLTVTTTCSNALKGDPDGDDLVRSVSPYEAAVAPEQTDPRLSTINSMYGSRCADIGVIQNLSTGSHCNVFSDLWTTFRTQNAGLF